MQSSFSADANPQSDPADILPWVPLSQLSRAPWIPVISMTLQDPPNKAPEGDTYLVPAGATGVWEGQTGMLAQWHSEWTFSQPAPGHGISLPDGRIFELVNGTYIEKIAIDAQSGKWTYAAAAGSANALTLTLDPPLSAYQAGVALAVKIPANNTGAMTIDVNGLGAIPVVRADGSPLQENDLVAGQIASLVCTGTAFQVKGLRAQYAGGNMAAFMTPGTTSFTVPLGIYKLSRLRVWGAGGGGGSSTGIETIGGGGGAGAYGERTGVPVVPGQVIPVTVGAGGTAGSPSGGPGGSTSFGSYIICQGGDPGILMGRGDGAPAPTISDGIALPGGRGYAGNIYNVNGTFLLLGGPGGASPFGGGITPYTSAGDIPGNIPGGGGSGSAAGNRTGGVGADGMIIVEY